MFNNENLHAIHDAQAVGIDERGPDREKNEELAFLIECVQKAIVRYELDSHCDSCVWRMTLPSYQPRLDENAPVERAIQNIFQETEADVAKATIDKVLKMTEQGATKAEIDKRLIKQLNRSARLDLNKALAIVREKPSQLEMLQEITEARWQNMKALAETLKHRISECQEQVKRDTGKPPNRSECQCLLIIVRLRIELGLNCKAIGAIIGQTEQATRKTASRCINRMRRYFENCHDFIES
jgi:hypothetical protein